MADYSFPPPVLRPLLDDISSLLKEKKETVSVAETAAGGLISASLLSVPGASSYYRGGLTVYTLESRLEFANWTSDHVANYKGPSTEVVAGLATSTRSKLQSTYAVSESGTAGPTGGNGNGNRKPGVVFVAVVGPGGTYTREVDTGFGQDREMNMVGFAAAALKLLRDVIKGDVKI